MTTQPDIICYSDNGLSFRAVPYNYLAQPGEVVFTTIFPPAVATPSQLASNFTGYVAAMTAQNATNAGVAALAAGVNITCTSTPSLNATYSISSASIANINAIETYILKNSAFPGSLTSLPWSDASGNMHTFPSTTLFSEFATAVANYVTLVTLYRDSGGAYGSLPSPNITIA